MKKTSSLPPNPNRETTSYPNFVTFQEDQHRADPDDNDTTLNKRPKTNDTEPSETSPFKGILSTSLSSGEMNVNHHRIVGFFPDQMDWPPSPNGSDSNVSVGSNPFEGILCPFNSFDTEILDLEIADSRFLYLRRRVGLAKLLFPMEAKVALDIAQVDGTCEFTLPSINSKNMVGAQRITMDLNDAPFKIKDEHLNRIRALSKTVELEKRFFPRCSEVLNKMMDDDDWSELAYIQNETQEERQLKKQRYMKLQDVIAKAFLEDKEELSKCFNIKSSSPSTSIGGVGRPNGQLTLKTLLPMHSTKTKRSSDLESQLKK